MREQLDAIQESLGLLFIDERKTEDMEFENAQALLPDQNTPQEDARDTEAGQVKQAQQHVQRLDGGDEIHAQRAEVQEKGVEDGKQLLLGPRVHPTVPPPELRDIEAV